MHPQRVVVLVLRRFHRYLTSLLDVIAEVPSMLVHPAMCGLRGLPDIVFVTMFAQYQIYNVPCKAIPSSCPNLRSFLPHLQCCRFSFSYQLATLAKRRVTFRHWSIFTSQGWILCTAQHSVQ